MSKVGVVIIGRNEGERLLRCFDSVEKQLPENHHVVYVDSGSTDGSVEFAKDRGFQVVNLDLSIPFTAARARNSGFECLFNKFGQLEFVQFLDGDCLLVDGWIEAAQKILNAHPEVAIACGRRREEYPEQTLYNSLCDIEWDTPVGEANACGGDFLIKVEAFQQVNGFNSSLIAGEEPELCLRLRQQSWRILRVDTDMTIHDAQMSGFHQWWKRTQRAGYAFAEGSWLHRGEPERYWVKESRRIWIWGVILPGVALMGAIPSHFLSLLLLFAYPVSAYRAYRYTCLRGFPVKRSFLYGLFCTLGKFPEAQGQLKYHFSRLFNLENKIIEYKNSS